MSDDCYFMPEDITIDNKSLATVLKNHKKWLNNEKGGKRATFKNQVFEHIDFRDYRDLSYSLFENCKFIHCKLDQVIFNKARFVQTVFNDSCWFYGCMFTCASFEECVINKCIFKYAIFTDAHFEATKIWLCEFNYAFCGFTKFWGCHLFDVKFSGANMMSIDCFISSREQTVFECCSFYQANCSKAVFNYANLKSCHFIEANLSEAQFRKTIITSSQFFSANLTKAFFADIDCGHMEDANFDNACIGDNVTNIKYHMICPEEGAFVAWKKAIWVKDSHTKEGVLVKLQIPANAKRSSGTGRKCRASAVKVLGFYDMNDNKLPADIKVRAWYNDTFIYTVGKTVKSLSLGEPDFNTNRWNECSAGIHFFMTKQEAKDYPVI